MTDLAVSVAPTTADTLATLRSNLDVLTKSFSVVELALFGSVARGEARPDSDIDVLVTIADGAVDEEGWHPSWALQTFLQELFGRRVDMVLHTELRPQFRKFVEADAIYVKRLPISAASPTPPTTSSGQEGSLMRREDKDPAVHLRDMLDCCEQIMEWMQGVSREEFRPGRTIFHAVIQQISALGEAGRRVPRDLRGDYRGIPWKRVTGMRDRLVHGYDQIDDDTVWDVVDYYVPKLIPHLQAALGIQPETEPSPDL